MKRKDFTENANILQRAFSSSLAGLPIAYSVNIFIFIPLVYYLDGYPWWFIGAVGAIPFFVTSMFRMYIIDWCWFKYKINLEPKYLCKRLYLLLTGKV
jgi:hypothetical protein